MKKYTREEAQKMFPKAFFWGSVWLGNNESLGRGIMKNNNGTFTAVTFSKSKDFKTIGGATRWMEKMCK